MKRNTKIARNDGAFSNGDGIDICICSRRTRYVAAKCRAFDQRTTDSVAEKSIMTFTLKAAHCNSNW